MSRKRYIAYEIKRLHNQLLRLAAEVHSNVKEMRDATSHQRWVIGFLFHEGKNRDIFQKDIEAECNIRGSTATSLLKRMEKKGFIVREKLSKDARWKRIILTQKAKDICIAAAPHFEKVENQMGQGIDKKELEIFFRVVDKIYSNLEKHR